MSAGSERGQYQLACTISSGTLMFDMLSALPPAA
jgi:hypothetical protein